MGIAIPSYRAVGTLESTLRSCIAQTLTDWVVWVMVDGDDSVAEEIIVAGLADPRIHLECNGTNLGQFENFNRAILRCYAAGARWIKPLCADDLLRSNALQRMVDLGESDPQCAFVYGYYDGIDAGGDYVSRTDVSKIASRIIQGGEFLSDAFPLFNPMGGPSSVMFRAELVEQCGLFDARLNYSGEADLWFRMLDRCDVGVVGEHVVLDYRFHDNSITGRGFLSVGRFTQPLDIIRNFAARYTPWSRRWWMAQASSGRVAATNLITALAIMRRGQVVSAMKGIWQTLLRLSPLAVPVAVARFISMSVRILTGRYPVPPHELAPIATRTTSPSEKTR